MLHKIKDEFNVFIKKEWINAEHKSKIQNVLTFINQVIKDFRMSDLKPGKIKEY